MSWVNERGPKKINVAITEQPWITDDPTSTIINGHPVGTSIINHQLVLFTTDNYTLEGEKHSGNDYIYVLKKQGNSLRGKLLFKGTIGLSTEHPLDTLSSYEADDVQKVYWTDGYNQPRVINIAASKDTLKRWNNKDKSDKTGNSWFDFCPQVVFNDNTKLVVTKEDAGNGTFTPGVIQYCYSLYNKYGQQTNIVDVSPLNYINYTDRGAKPNDSIGCSFKIVCNNLDSNFEYARLYSIQRTSINSTPVVKRLADFPIRESKHTDAKPFTRTEVYSTDSSLVLPKSDNGRILTVNVTNGSYEVAVSHVLGSFSIGTNDVSVVAIDAATNEVKSSFMTFQELIDYFYNVTDERIRGTYILHDYYFDLWMDDEQILSISDLCEKSTKYRKWGIIINGKLVCTSDNYFDIVYSYKSETWLIVDSNNSVKVTITDNSTEAYDTPNGINYVDNGTTGDEIDPRALLFIGGKSIAALTMNEKDNTLFLGNIKSKGIQIPKESIINNSLTTGVTFSNDKIISLDHSYGVYAYTNQSSKLNQQKITTFKGGEWYRFGIQLQSKTGEWSEPIFLKDAKNDHYPVVDFTNKTASLAIASCNIDLSVLNSICNLDLISQIRPVVVYPSMSDRRVICQGVVNPTVFNSEDRITNSPYAQASWFFRPNMINAVNNSKNQDVRPIKIWSDSPTENTIKDSQFDDFLYKKCYVIRLDTLNDNADIDEITKRGYLKGKLGPVESKVSFDGIIRVMDIRYNKYYYFFIKYNEEWPPTGYIEFKNAQFIDHVQYIYSGLKTNSNYYLYYSDASQNDDATYTFYITNDGKDSQYSFIFRNLGWIDGNNVATEYREGNSLPFIHYSSLVNQDDVLKCFNTDAKIPDSLPKVIQDALRDMKLSKDADYSYKAYGALQSVEIQGSQVEYGSPFTTTKSNPDVFNNTEFFVDQSIVTLNSPDIEFDSSVRNQDTNNLKFRVIGYIPITSNASAHHIYYKNSMLPLNIEMDESGKITSNNEATNYGQGELPKNIVYSSNPISTYAGNRLIADWLWNDSNVNNKDGKVTTAKNCFNYMIYPWQRVGSLNGDSRTADKASSYLNMKKESTLLYSLSSVYTTTVYKNLSYVEDYINYSYDNIGAQMVSTESANLMNVRLPKQQEDDKDINYYPNIDKVLINGNNYSIVGYNTSTLSVDSSKSVSGAIRMQYKSTPHAIIDIKNGSNGEIDIMPKATFMTGEADHGTYLGASAVLTPEYSYSGTEKSTFWGSKVTFDQPVLPLDTPYKDKNTFNYLWLGELYKEGHEEFLFGGTTESAIKENVWNIGGSSYALTNEKKDKALVTGASPDDKNLHIEWNIGDTYYQRYDCLKTYPFTNEDTNQITEILSFMCETHINLDGRYDRNRGLLDNTNITPVNFNLFNPVYSQRDNFFSYKSVFDEKKKYPNIIAYTMTKTPGADVDEYTHITMSSVLQIDGNRGSINAIKKLNDALIVFQDTAIAQLLYNENTQIASQTGVPIEIANSGKVQGVRYISNTIGCIDKASIAQSPNGIYFIDSYGKALYLYNGQLKNISMDGFNVWMHNHIKPSSDGKWRPDTFNNPSLVYDGINHDILLIDDETALAYSELTGTFTSFYDHYANIPYFVNYEDMGLWIDFDRTTDISKHNAGNYYDDYSITLVGNPDPQFDKTFTNLDIRASVEGEGEIIDNKYTPYYPFDNLEVWNEYQNGIAKFSSTSNPSIHGLIDSSLVRKYRIWHCDIPRDNADESYRKLHNLSSKASPLDRIRNLWAYIKLSSKVKMDENGKPKKSHRTEIHDVVLTYFI